MNLNDAIELIEARNLPAACKMLEELLEQDEVNEQAWFWLSKAVDDIDSHIICLENVLAINPNNTAAYNRLKELGALPEQKKVDITPTQDILQPATNQERDLREQLDELKYKYRMLETFSISIIPEVRTPLTALRGYSELLLSDAVGELNEKQRKFLTAMNSLVEDIDYVIEQIFNLHRALLGELFLNFEEVDIEKLLQPVKPDNLNLEIPSEAPKIWGDPRHLSQVFRGLFSGEVLGWYETEASLQVNYDDEQMYFKLVSTGDTGYLGSEDYSSPILFYSQVVIEKHGGEYRLERSKEGVEVTFSLPIVRN